MENNFWQQKNKEILKSMAINTLCIYIGGFVIVQITLIGLALNGGQLIFVWERHIVIKGIQILSIAVVGLAINMYWIAWQEYKKNESK